MAHLLNNFQQKRIDSVGLRPRLRLGVKPQNLLEQLLVGGIQLGKLLLQAKSRLGLPLLEKFPQI